MTVWLLTALEPLPVGADRPRPTRTGGLAAALADAGHDATWWAGAADGRGGAPRVDRTTARPIVTAGGRYRLVLLAARGHRAGVSWRRLLSDRDVAAGFARLAPREPAPDAIVASTASVGLAAAATAYGRLAGVPVVLDLGTPMSGVIPAGVPARMRPDAWPFAAWRDRCLTRTLAGAASICGAAADVRRAIDRIGRDVTDLDRIIAPTGPATPDAEAADIAAATIGLLSRLTDRRGRGPADPGDWLKSPARPDDGGPREIRWAA